jgi:hypothetical protein
MYQTPEVNNKVYVATSPRPLTVNYRILVTRLSCYGLDGTADPTVRLAAYKQEAGS